MQNNTFNTETKNNNKPQATTVSELADQIERFTSESRPGKVRTGILLWALGVPIPLVLLFLLIRGCMGG